MKKTSAIVFTIIALLACGCSPDHSSDTAPPVPAKDAGAKANPNTIEGNPYIPADVKEKMKKDKAAGAATTAPTPAPATGGN